MNDRTHNELTIQDAEHKRAAVQAGVASRCLKEAALGSTRDGSACAEPHEQQGGRVTGLRAAQGGPEAAAAAGEGGTVPGSTRDVRVVRAEVAQAGCASR